jgi:hypothetical protein
MPRAYLTAEQLAALTPWSLAAINAMVRRGQLVRGVHWFQPAGHRGLRIFKWEAITAYIEGGSAEAAAPAPLTEEEADRVTRAVSQLLALG